MSEGPLGAVWGQHSDACPKASSPRVVPVLAMPAPASLHAGQTAGRVPMPRSHSATSAPAVNSDDTVRALQMRPGPDCSLCHQRPHPAPSHPQPPAHCPALRPHLLAGYLSRSTSQGQPCRGGPALLPPALPLSPPPAVPTQSSGQRPQTLPPPDNGVSPTQSQREKVQLRCVPFLGSEPVSSFLDLL